jgi:hypothetical protein
MIVRDAFVWTAGEQSDTRKVFWIQGSVLNGRWIIELYPRDPRIDNNLKEWRIYRPQDQAPLDPVIPEETGDSEGSDLTVEKRRTMKFISKSAGEMKRLVTGVVLVPEEPDAQGDIYSEEEIEDSMIGFMRDWRKSSTMGEMHKTTTDEIDVIENWQAKETTVINGQTIKKGTWMLTTQVHKDDAWAKVQSGEYSGYSIGGRAKVEPLT